MNGKCRIHDLAADFIQSWVQRFCRSDPHYSVPLCLCVGFLLSPLLEHERTVRPTEAERIRQRIRDLTLAGDVRHVIEIALRVLVLDVARRGQYAVTQR